MDKETLVAAQQAAWAAQSAAEAAWWALVPNVIVAVLTATAALGAAFTWWQSILDARRREVAIIYALLHPMLAAAHVLTKCIDASLAKKDVRATYWAVMTARSLDQQLDLLRHFRLAELPTRAVVDFYAGAIACIEGAKLAISNALSLEPFSDETVSRAMTEYLRQINAINTGLEADASKISRGRS